MIRQLGTPFEPENPEQLRLVGDALCQDLRVENGAVEFDELQEVYRSIYQPQLTAWVRALFRYVPDNDPRIMVTTKAGADRQLTRSADLERVSQPLDPHYTSTQLKSVVKVLSELLEYLPPKN